MMRAHDWTTPDSPEDGVPASPAGPRSLRGYIPCWLGRTACEEPIDHLAPMLRALNTAASAYLGIEVTSKIVVLPARLSFQMLSDLARASSRASLRLQVWLVSPAGQMAAYANGLTDGDDCQYGERRVLTIDCSRAALTILLLDQECGVIEGVRGSYSPGLGANNWSGEVEDAMLGELRKVVRNEKAPETSTPGFDNLVLLGELGDDHRLRRVLGEAFDDLQEADGNQPAMKDRAMIPPLFAAARGAARWSLVRGGDDREERRIASWSWLRPGS